MMTLSSTADMTTSGSSSGGTRKNAVPGGFSTSLSCDRGGHVRKRQDVDAVGLPVGPDEEIDAADVGEAELAVELHRARVVLPDAEPDDVGAPVARLRERGRHQRL